MCADTTAQTPSYKDTLNLPKTDFPMRAGLPKREPEWLAHWEKIGVYDRLRKLEGRPVFCLHDGPPYANGNLHIGHALNKTIKDMIVRSHQMMGYDSRYIPGWDCHGLPIEWKIEEAYRKKAATRMTCRSLISAANAVPLRMNGLTCSAPNSSVWASLATGKTPI